MSEQKVHFAAINNYYGTSVACGRPSSAVEWSDNIRSVTCGNCKKVIKADPELVKKAKTAKFKPTISTASVALKTLEYKHSPSSSWFVSQEATAHRGLIMSVDPDLLVVQVPCGDKQKYKREELLGVAQAIIDTFGDKPDADNKG